MRRHLLLVAVPSVLTAAQLVAQPAAPASLSTVARLYHDFRAEADDPTLSFVDQPRAVVARYFDRSLTELLLAERACVTRSHAVCQLDFALLWGSQDPDAHDVTVRQTKDPAVVVVGLGGSEGSRYLELTYRMVKTADGWRVHDIVYPPRRSLRALLAGRRAE